MPPKSRRSVTGRENSASKDAAILDRTGVIIPAKDWSAFKAWFERPAEAILRLSPNLSGGQLSHLISAPKKPL